MPITIAICDDEKSICENILRLVNNQCGDCCVDLYNSGDTLLAANIEYDIYFLDIQMPGINGISAAEQIRKRQEAMSQKESVIIFITALKEYMEDAFDVKAFHYLVKPFDKDKFNSVFSRAINDCRKAKENAENHILIKSGNSYSRVLLKDIFYIESSNNKVVVNSTSGVMEYYGTMKEIENILGNAFYRCHRFYIVNMNYVTRYNANSIWVKNGDEILIAQKKYPHFVKAYMMFTRSGGTITWMK